MFALARVNLPAPVSLLMPAGRGRIVGVPIPGTVPRVVAGFDACFRINPVTRTIHAEMPPLPRALLIYGGEDFAGAAADTPEQHAARVLEILGADPAGGLQALIDGRAMPEPPPRVPREVANWRVKAVLHQRGLLAAAGAALDALPEPGRTIARLAWDGDAKLARTSPAVAFIAASIGLVPAEIDQAFIAAEGLVI